jgi:hypothetical protein
MERLFSPCARLHDLLVENQDNDDYDYLEDDELPFNRGEVKELNLDVSTEEFLSAERRLRTRTYTPCWETERRLRG